MLNQLSSKITAQLIENGTIDEENEEIYAYGLEQAVIMFLNILTTLFTGVLFGMVWQSIIFMIVYLPLRSYAGGYHASTVLRCYFIGIILTVTFLLILKVIPGTSITVIILTVIASLIILLLAPVEASNKPLDDIELTMYKKRTRLILVSDIGIITILLAFDLNNIAFAVVVALMILSIMLSLQYVLNNIKRDIT